MAALVYRFSTRFLFPILRTGFLATFIAITLCVVTALATAADDPGLRGGTPGAGTALPGLTSGELDFFDSGAEEFLELNDVSTGLGPRFNARSCKGCHSQPAVGGSAPATNPQINTASINGATNVIPSFISLNGPVREARFVRHPDGTPDGGVKQLFTLKGRSDAPGCTLAQPDFAAAVAANNVGLRIPTPVFGLGLIEAINESSIMANKVANVAQKAASGIAGHENRNDNDGTITRFGWKAQNKSLLVFSGEAYNAEMGVTNEMFPNETDETVGCVFNVMPEDQTRFTSTLLGSDVVSDIMRFTHFMRFLAPPTPMGNNFLPGVANGRNKFEQIGCALCHTPSFTTGANAVTALSNQPVNLFSDLLVHRMGPGLADGIAQGGARGDEFRTAPLWGLGQRIFFLHDGRTTDLVQAIQAHRSNANASFPASEANAVIDEFNALNDTQKQHLLNFLRSL